MMMIMMRTLALSSPILSLRAASISISSSMRSSQHVLYAGDAARGMSTSRSTTREAREKRIVLHHVRGALREAPRDSLVAPLIRLSVRHTRPDASSCHPEAEAVLVVISTGSSLCERRTAEFA